MDPEKKTSSGVADDCNGNASPSEAEPMNATVEKDCDTSELQSIVDGFAQDTSLLGVPRLILATTRISRFFWVIVCLVCAIMFIVGLSELFTLYFSYPKKVTVEIVAKPVPFPAITLCNQRSIDFDILNRINDLLIQDPQATSFVNKSLGSPFIEAYFDFIAKFTQLWNSDSPTDNLADALMQGITRMALYADITDTIISAASISLHQYVALCTLGGVPCNLTRDFSLFFHSYYFNCYTYKDPLSSAANVKLKEKNSDEDMPWLSPGLDNGLSMIVLTGSGMLTRNKQARVIPGLYDRRSATAGGDGVRVIVHAPDVVPFPLAEGFDVPPGFAASLGVRPRSNVRIGPPHGDCVNKNPLFPDSKTPYRQMACQQLCMQKEVRRECGCYDETLPIIVRPVDRPTCRSTGHFPTFCTRYAGDECFQALLTQYNRIRCAFKVREKVRAKRSIMADCGCRAPCDELVYDVSYSVSRWPAQSFEGDVAFYDLIDTIGFKYRFNGTTIKRHFNESGDRLKAMRDFARINVYVADPEVLVTTETPEYEKAQLISDIGGQLGVWIGASLITAAEIFELVCQIINQTLIKKWRAKHRPT